ncbi:cobalt-zinc-cadmium efflux system membrane fusion protein [Rhodoblastus acidophilus]|uniref:efflux RND transporter periplasmic adaptor subunit n=1 Tax=Rhodoblastus acidophilus TaxID=1074 RepID=UPI002224345A|nr:efflux RND transporter periplasmic adaptor subunit [Rhodoblastus acidophilus]MCW2285133.1 cobalt-zinc-cadmium efflux system membrane fusion protein [Rhodoblastus acidophilus]MCW2334009.1 cobalt-zinc-cadmium efflux system membrane fusion protein [Rhodoblastus acidophilus]
MLTSDRRRNAWRICLWLAAGLAVWFGSDLSLAAQEIARELAIAPEQMPQFDAGAAEVRAAKKSIVAALPATIIPPMNARIAVAAPFAGTVVKVNVLPGQAVKKGDALVTLASRDLSETIVRLKQAEADLLAAEVLLKRQRELFQKDLVTANRVAEAEAQVEKVRALAQETRRLLAMGAIQQNSGGYSLTAPEDGRIVEVRPTPGAALQAMEAAVLLDASDQLWAQAQLPGAMVGKVAVGDRVELPQGDSGKVISVGISLDPVTRSTTLLAEISAKGDLMTGQTTTISVVRPGAAREFEIAADAIAWIGGKPFVFIRGESGFAPAQIAIKGRNADVATVESDALKPGQKLATNGLAQLEHMMSGN